MRVALLTAEKFADTDDDLPVLLNGLRAAGVTAEALAWDDPRSEPAGFDRCVLRCTWNYYHTPERFLDWLTRAAAVSRVLNPLPVIRWNIHKRYLFELEAAGVPIVPTELAPSSAQLDLRAILARRGWNDVVIKPAISAGSFQTRRFTDEVAAAQAFLAEQGRIRDMLIQPYLPSVAGGGERSLVWIDGEVTHVVSKRPRFAGHEESVVAAAPATADELALAAAAIERWRDQLLYARIDTIRDDDGQVRLSELELMEPSMFFDLGPGSLDRYVVSVLRG